MRHFFLILLLAAVGNLQAGRVWFDDRNFSVEVPEGWVTFELPEPSILLAIRNAETGQVILTSAIKLAPRERFTGAGEVREGIKTGYKNTKITIDTEGSTTVNSVPFLTILGHNDRSKHVCAFVTSADGVAYAFQSISDTPSEDGGPDFQAFLESFELKRPAKFTAEADANRETAAYRTGHTVGTFIAKMIILIIGILILVGVGSLVYWLATRRKRKTPPPLPP